MHEHNLARKHSIPNNRLKEERERRGLTQREVAELINLPDDHTVGRWERGISSPQPHYRRELCRIFEKSPEELGLLKQKSAKSGQQRSPVESKRRVVLAWKMPLFFTSFVGREQEIAAVCAMLGRTDVRLITLLGPAGVGKTRLAIQIAAELRDGFTDGGCLVSLGAINDPSLVIPTIAEALGVQESREQCLIEGVKFALGDKHFLLLLDNFEHVVAASPAVEELLAACPNLKVLVTSRAVLHLQAECEFVVSPLAVPKLTSTQEPEELMQCASVNLFVQRTRSILSDFSITKSNARVLAEICVRLEGLPLAIELAAARIKLLPPQALLTRLSERLKILKSKWRTLPERQQTLRNTMTWSYELLDTQEKWLFRQLAIFAGGCSLETAEALFGKRGESSIDVLDIIAALLDKSLLQQVEREGEASRFVMLETMREYGLDCLHATGEIEECQRAYAMYYLEFVEKASSYLKGALQSEWLARLERELENLRAALEWFVKQQKTEHALRFCEAFGKFCGLRGYWNEEQRWLKIVLELSRTHKCTIAHARVLRRAGHLAYRLRDLTAARALQEKSVALSYELGDKQNLAGALSGLAWVLYRQNDVASTDLLLKKSVEIARESEDTWALANSLESAGRFMHFQGNISKAYLLLEESVALARELEDRESLARILTTLASLQISQGHMIQAAALAEESLALAKELGTKPLIALACDCLGYVAMLQGEYEQAIAIFEERIKQAQELGDRPTVALKYLQLGDIALAQGNLTQAMALVQESLIFFRKQGDIPNIATALGVLGDIKRAQRDYVQSIAYYKEILSLDEKLAQKRAISRCLVGLAQVAMDQGQLEQAAHLFRIAQSWLNPGVDMYPAQRMDYERAVEKLRFQLGELVAETEQFQGCRVATDQILNLIVNSLEISIEGS